MDRTIIEQAMAGDRRAFRRLVEDHQSFVFSISYRMVADRGEAEDITQEAFIRLWKHLPKYRFDVKLSTWLYAIATNLCLDFLKSRRRKDQKNTAGIDNFITVHGLETADTLMLNEELKALVVRNMEKLTPKQKAVFVLRDMEGLSMNEVTEILSMSSDNIKSNLYHARVKMSELLAGYYDTSKIKES